MQYIVRPTLSGTGPVVKLEFIKGQAAKGLDEVEAWKNRAVVKAIQLYGEEREVTEVSTARLDQMTNSPSSPSANPTEGSTSRPSLDPLDPLTPRSYYEYQSRAQEGGAVLDVFAVHGLPANNAGLTQYGAHKHYLKRVARHVFERGDAASHTVGPLVPLWSHVNVAKNMLIDDATPEEFEHIGPFTRIFY